MKRKKNLSRYLGIILLLAALFIFISPEYADARRGRSFGGRRSFSRRMKAPRRSKAPRRTTSQRRSSSPRTATRSVPKNKQTSFGGARMNSSKAYTSKYGTPRKPPKTLMGMNAAGSKQKYIMHDYGGYGSGLMTGYLMGRTSWLWMTPFHPAFYYSKPYYVNNPDGTMSVYPPTFSISKLFFTLLVFGGIIWIIYRILRSRRGGGSGLYSQSSFN